MQFYKGNEVVRALVDVRRGVDAGRLMRGKGAKAGEGQCRSTSTVGGCCAKMEERSGSDYEMGIGVGGRSSGGIWSREVTINGAGSKLSGSGSCCGLNQIACNP